MQYCGFDLTKHSCCSLQEYFSSFTTDYQLWIFSKGYHCLTFTNISDLHLVSFISNDLFKRLVGKFPVFWAVAYFFLKILDSRCLFYIVNFEKLHHFYRYFCNTWIFIFEASINNILRLKKGIIVGTNTKYCHYSFILDFKLLKCCLKFSAKN